MMCTALMLRFHHQRFVCVGNFTSRQLYLKQISTTCALWNIKFYLYYDEKDSIHHSSDCAGLYFCTFVYRFFIDSNSGTIPDIQDVK